MALKVKNRGKFSWKSLEINSAGPINNRGTQTSPETPPEKNRSRNNRYILCNPAQSSVWPISRIRLKSSIYNGRGYLRTLAVPRKDYERVPNYLLPRRDLTPGGCGPWESWTRQKAHPGLEQQARQIEHLRCQESWLMTFSWPSCREI